MSFRSAIGTIAARSFPRRVRTIGSPFPYTIRLTASEISLRAAVIVILGIVAPLLRCANCTIDTLRLPGRMIKPTSPDTPRWTGSGVPLVPSVRSSVCSLRGKDFHPMRASTVQASPQTRKPPERGFVAWRFWYVRLRKRKGQGLGPRPSVTFDGCRITSCTAYCRSPPVPFSVVVLGGVGVSLAVQHDPQDLLLREHPQRLLHVRHRRLFRLDDEQDVVDQRCEGDRVRAGKNRGDVEEDVPVRVVPQQDRDEDPDRHRDSAHPGDRLAVDLPPARLVHHPKPQGQRAQQRHQGDGEKDRQQQCGEEDQGYSLPISSLS